MLFHFGFRPETGALGQDDFGSAFYVENAFAGSRVDQCRHEFAFGGEGHLIDRLRGVAQRGVVGAPVFEPQQQCPFGRVADHFAVRVQEGGRVRGDSFADQRVDPVLGEFGFVNAHFIAGQRAGLVGADHRDRSHRFAGVHFPDEVIRTEHPPHVDRERQRDAHRQSFRHGHDDQRDGYHEVLQHFGCDGQPVGRQQVARQHTFDDQRCERDDRQRDADASDQLRQALQLQVQRGLFIALDGGLFGDFAEFGGVPYGGHLHDAMAFDHGRSAHDVVGRISRFFVEMGRVGRFADLRFPGQRRFVDLQRHGFLQNSVGRHLFAAFEQDDVADHDLFFRDLGDGSVADGFHRRVVVGAVQHVEFLHRVVFEPECDAGSQEDRAENADRFGEFIMYETDPERQHGRHQQDADDRIVEFFDEQAPQRFAFRRGEQVGAVLFAASDYFVLRESFQGIRHGVWLIRVMLTVRVWMRPA